MKESRAAVPTGAEAVPVPVLRGLIRDFTAGLNQQMYFWGRDVLYPDGNLLTDHGFARMPSGGLKGTSCYRMQLADGDHIELHGACVGRYPAVQCQSPGFLFVRARQRIFLYSGSEPAIPGRYVPEQLRPGSAVEMYAICCQFLDWWLAYEEWITTRVSPGFRDACHWTFQHLPASAPWLPPAEALAWLRAFRESPTTVPRARNWKVHPSRSRRRA